MKRIKSVILVLLTFSMCFLCYATLMVSSGRGINYIFGEFSVQNGKSDGKESEYKASAVPAKISVAGEHILFTEENITVKSEIYKDCERFITEAIGSMSSVEEITAEQYKEAVFQNSLIVKYSGEIPLFMLSEWSGGHISDRFSVRIMGFSKSEWDIYAYFKDEASEKYYRSKTAAGVQFLADIAEKYRTQNAVFAEKYISDFDGNEAEVLCTESPVVNILQIKEGSYAFDDGKEEDILRILGINPYLAKSYQESSDVRIYVEGDGVLRADTQGRLTYSASESGIETGAVDGKETALAAVDKLYELASVLYGENTDMRFDIDEVKTDGSDADVQCVLKYGGISLEGDRFGAGVSVSDGKIIKLWIDNPYLEKSEYLTVLSTADAAALKPDKSSFETVYIWQNGLFMPITGAEEN